MEIHESKTSRIRSLFVLPAAIVIQACLGGIYAWSAFVAPLRKEYGFTSGQTQLVFGLAIATFTVAMVFAGRLLPRWGPRRVALLGGGLFACGHWIAGRSDGRFAWLLVGFGLLHGASIGCGYVAALTAGIQWFPRNRGLVTGVAVAGFGAGAIVLSSLADSLMKAGWTVLRIFQAIGWGYGATVCFAACFLFRPPRAAGGGVDLRTGRNLSKDPFFRAMVAGVFCGTFAGLLVVGNLEPIGMDGGLTSGAATIAVGLFAVGNAAGRIAWGWISDRLGYITVPVSLLFLGASLVFLMLARFSAVAFWTGSFMVGLGFGACFVLYAAQVASRYGTAEVARVYPLVFLAYGVAGITGPPLGGYLYDLTRNYGWSLVAGVAVLAIGAGWTWAVRGIATHRTDAARTH